MRAASSESPPADVHRLASIGVQSTRPCEIRKTNYPENAPVAFILHGFQRFASPPSRGGFLRLGLNSRPR